ncbi:uncharacterized protein LOC131004545 [Salvia miltiorrhiza]|uniref:uncharacterized protein LOC131004545 n=1 Tax=Salvia miltiorrhiza TaxID=226208 RepID=UPI0025ABFA42|nr:uncharacterized protein LOC131004545 [Salvia miltiorrhiza]
MELKSRDENEEPKKAVSVLQGDGICMSRILARESSAGQSSRVFYRSNEGVPFGWEMQPGTAKNPQQDEDVIPPICPSPLMQSLHLDLPPPPLKTSKIWRLREMIMMKKAGGRNKEQESSRFPSTSTSTFSSATSRVVDVSMVDGPFIPAILEQGKTRIYYCSLHNNAFAVEQGNLYVTRFLSEPEQFSGPLHGGDSAVGVPFGWEMHPGTPKAAGDEEIIPPPSPPPAAQSLSLPRPDMKAKRSTWRKAWFWIRRRKTKEIMKMHEISFRYDEKWGVDGDASSLRSSSSSAAPLSRGGGWRIGRNLESTRDLLVFARRKWKSLVS